MDAHRATPHEPSRADGRAPDSGRRRPRRRRARARRGDRRPASCATTAAARTRRGHDPANRRDRPCRRRPASSPRSARRRARRARRRRTGSSTARSARFPGSPTVATAGLGARCSSRTWEESARAGSTGPTDVTKLVPATGETTRIGGSGSGSAREPGRAVPRYGVSCDGPSLGFTRLATGENYGSDALGKCYEGAVARDEAGRSARLVARLEPVGLPGAPRGGRRDPHYYVGRLWPVVPQAQTQVVELPNGPGISTATFLDDDTVALAEPRGGTTEVRRWAVSSGARETASPMIFEVPGGVMALVADASGQHLLAVTDDRRPLPLVRGGPGPTKLADGRHGCGLDSLVLGRGRIRARRPFSRIASGHSFRGDRKGNPREEAAPAPARPRHRRSRGVQGARGLIQVRTEQPI